MRRMTKAQFDVLEKAVSDGRRARGVLEAAACPCPVCAEGQPTILSQRERQIAVELVLWFRTATKQGNVCPEVAVRYAAALSEVFALREKLQGDAKAGAEAQHSMMTTAEDDTDDESEN